MLAANTLLRNGRYRIMRRIGEGGQGAVYETWDLDWNARVAVKEALVDDPVLNRAFEREALRLIRLRHAALPRGIEYFVENDKQYFVMEYIGGMDLKEQLRQRQGAPFSVPRVLAWTDQLLELLTYLHEQTPPLIHRDIKPANLKVTPDGNIILLDFGLAKGGLTPQTIGRSLQGYTRGYAPLEQILGSPTNERSDLYALGATVYTLLTGQVPSDAGVRYSFMKQESPEPLRLANQLNPDIPAPVAQLLADAMALKATKRPASARAMRAILHRSAFSHTKNLQNISESSASARFNNNSPQNRVNSLPTKPPFWTPLPKALITIAFLLLISGLTIILISNAPQSGNVPANSTPEVNLTNLPATQIVVAADNSPTATRTNTPPPTVSAPTSTPLPTVPPPTSTPPPTQPAATATQPPATAIPPAAIQSGNWYGTLTNSNFNGCVGFEVVDSSEIRNVIVSGASRLTDNIASFNSSPPLSIQGNCNFNNATCNITIFCPQQENYLNNNAFESCNIVVGTFTSNTTARGSVDSSSQIDGTTISGTWSAEPSTKKCK